MDPTLADQLRDRTGYIHQKVRTVAREVIEIFNDALRTNTHLHYDFDMVTKGDWNNLRITADNGMDVQAGVGQRYTQLQEEVGALTRRFAEAGIASDEIDNYTTETLQVFQNKVLGVQQQLRYLLEVHDEAKGMAERGVDQRHLREFLERRISLQEPLVKKLFFSGQESSIETRNIIVQFAHADFQSLFTE